MTEREKDYEKITLLNIRNVWYIGTEFPRNIMLHKL